MTAPADNAVAIIGMACRFPGGVNTPDDFWALLEQGRDATGPIPLSRFDIANWYDEDVDKPGRIAARRGGFLDGGIGAFDAGFFDLPPAEAEAMDPQIRLLLELGYEVLEDAGQDLNRLAGGRHGIYAGVCFSEYHEQLKAAARPLDSFFICGTNSCSASGRLSYHFGFEGPSLTLNAACSSSLLGVHLACRDLVAGETDLALAGGVNLMLSAETFVGFSRLRVLAPDGRCKAFDAAADGYARAEGAGLVCLKRLADALADGDHVLAVIEGTAVTNDGAARGYTAPRPEAQEKAIRQALHRAGAGIGDIDVIEAHGTGTRLGDRMEIKALAPLLAERDAALPPVKIGAVKSNFGHCEAAAGIASLMKMVLALRAGKVPAHLNFTTLNPAIDWPANLVVNAGTSDWPALHRRRAGINSFGMSGVNVHVVLAEAQHQSAPAAPMGDAPLLLPLTARSPEALVALGKAWLSLLDGAAEADARQLLASQVHRRTFCRNRLTAVGASPRDLRADLDRRLGLSPTDVRGPVAVGLLLTGEALSPGLLEIEPYRSAHEAARLRLPDLAPDAANVHAGHHAMVAQLAALGVNPTHFDGTGIGRVTARELSGLLPPDETVRALSTPAPDDLAAAAERLVRAGAGVVLQVGGSPQAPSLSLAVPASDGGEDMRNAPWLPALAPAEDPRMALAMARARLHDHGVDLPRDVFHADPGASWRDTPRYPWQRQTYWVAAAAEVSPRVPVSQSPGVADVSGSPLERVTAALSAALGLPPSRIDPDLAMSGLGLDSLMAVTLVARLGNGLSPTAIWNHPTPRKLARHLAEREAPQAKAPPAKPAASTVLALEAELDGLLARFG